MLYLRMTSITVSSMLLTVLAFLAATHKITPVLDQIFTPKAMDVFTEKDPPPPLPPPPVPKEKEILPPVIETSLVNATPTPIPVTEPQPQPPAAPAPTKIVGANWLKLPGAREFDRYYPTRAQEREKEGRVMLNCAVNADGSISCSVASETPEGWGFGDAAIQISKSFRMAPRTVNGEPTSGGTISVPIAFKLNG